MVVILIIILAAVGAALIAGGVVGYRASSTAGAKVVSAAAIAAGLVLWVGILLIVPVTSSTEVGERQKLHQASALAASAEILTAWLRN